MRTIRHILLTTLVICHLGAFGQSTLQFVSKEWNFGSIREESGPIAHTFEATNRSEYPEVILDVTSTCGCTKPLFTRRPVRPGDTTAVTVRFNPAGQSGLIDRTLVVYGSGNRVIERLRITGRVEPRARTIEERFPIVAGEGIHLTNNFLPFETLPHGRETGAEIGIANDSESASRRAACSRSRLRRHCSRARRRRSGSSTAFRPIADVTARWRTATRCRWRVAGSMSA